MSALSELSILIVTWNGDELLKNCLDSVRRACGTEPEIVVVDNANLESTKALVATHLNAQYIAAPENLGFAGGNNLGLPLCTRPYILLLNNDTIVHEEPFTQLIQYLKDHPKVAVVQGKMRLVRFGDVLDECGSYLTSWGETYARGYMLPTSIDIPNGPIYHAKGACLMFRKCIISEMGNILFHNHFKSNYEDVDFSHRVWLTGHEVHFVNTSPVDHLQGMTVAKVTDNIVDVRAEANKFFSIFTTLSTHSRRTILTYQKVLFALVLLRYTITLNIPKIRRFIAVLRMIHHEMPLANKTHALVQATRKVSDDCIFSKIMVKVPFAFHLDRLRGKNLSEIYHNAIVPSA